MTFEPLKAPRTALGPIRELFSLDLVWFFAGSHNIACKLHAITEDFQSSREAPKSHFPSFATLPSENVDFHE